MDTGEGPTAPTPPTTIGDRRRQLLTTDFGDELRW
jgi:hypothetical protein